MWTSFVGLPIGTAALGYYATRRTVDVIGYRVPGREATPATRADPTATKGSEAERRTGRELLNSPSEGAMAREGRDTTKRKKAARNP